MSNYFSKLPNNLVWSKEEGEVSLCKDNDKLLPVIVYLDTHNSNITNECYFSLADMIESIGMKVRKGKDGTVNQIREILKYLQSINWLKGIDVDTIKPSEFVKCKFEMTYKKDDADNDNEWFKLYYDNYVKIMNNNSKLDKFITLKVYCYILSRIKRNSEEKTLKDARKYKSHEGVKVETFYDTYEAFNSDLGISKNTVLKQHLELLVELGLIAYGNIGQVKKKGFQHTANNCYCEDKEELERALDCSREYYIGEGYILTGKEVKKTSKTVKGLKGVSQSLENKGKDNSHIVKEIEEIKQKEKEQAIKEAKENKTKYMGLKSKPNRSWYTNEEETDNNNVDKMWSDGSLLTHLQCLVMEYNDYVEKDNRVNNMDAFINKFRNIEDIDELDVKIKDFKYLVEVATNECYDGADDLM